MVTIGIFVLMTALILARYDVYSYGSLLSNVAYDVALTIRQAQTYGTSVKVADSTANDYSNYKAAYGVHFDMSSPSQFILFSDVNNNGTRDGSDLTITTYNIKKGTRITGLCSGSDSASCTNRSMLAVSFRRPEPKAIICDENGNCVYGYAKITVAFGDDPANRRDIVVRSVGQVTVGN